MESTFLHNITGPLALIAAPAPPGGSEVGINSQFQQDLELAMIHQTNSMNDHEPDGILET
eukprot:scaffold340817_cov13-Prasinocladus_malaysianus.AAC.2